MQNSMFYKFTRVLDEVTRPSLFTERIGLFAGKSNNEMILHHVVHGVSLNIEYKYTFETIIDLVTSNANLDGKLLGAFLSKITN